MPRIYQYREKQSGKALAYKTNKNYSPALLGTNAIGHQHIPHFAVYFFSTIVSLYFKLQYFPPKRPYSYIYSL